MVLPRPKVGIVEACDRGVFHVEQAGGRGYGPMRLHGFQRDFLRAVIDTYDAEGHRRFRRALAGWMKKLGKSTCLGMTGLWHLLFDTHHVADGAEHHPRLPVVGAAGGRADLLEPQRDRV